ncbi:MAG: ATP synthase F1 subunit epsilon [Rickettsiaceae bacterium]|nr:ATP synthase F1 subunit epsilon [Rickettsiaceae bacterium]
MYNSPLFSVKIILPSETVFSAMANLVELPGEHGVIGVLQNHKPLLANLKVGKLLIHTEDSNIVRYYLYGGIARISNNSLEILSDFVLDLKEYNKNKIITELERLKCELQDHKSEKLYYDIISNKIDRYQSSLEFMDN